MPVGEKHDPATAVAGSRPGRTILMVNNYPMRVAEQAVADGVYPAHHLWGIDALRRSGRKVEIVEAGGLLAGLFDRWGRLNRLGNLPRQLAVLRHRRSGSVVYAANEGDLRLICLARRAGVFRQPIVVLFHHMPGLSARAWLGGADVALCLSKAVASRIRDKMGVPPARVIHAAMGADLDFPGYVLHTRGTNSHAEPGWGSRPLVVSAGKSNRDTSTLLAAIRRVDVPAIVYVPQANRDGLATARGRGGSTSLRVVPVTTKTQLPYMTVLRDMRRASIVAIPLATSDGGLAGLSELLDAMALAKPVVMTRNPLIDIDVESIGCGLWVDPGDVHGWVRALERLRDDEEERRRMGQKGRSAVETDFNYGSFCRVVRDDVFAPIERQLAQDGRVAV